MSAQPGVLDFGVTITTPAAGILVLEDSVNGYEVHKDSFGQRATTLRKQEISSSYVEGSFVTQAVRENVTETLAVWVSGSTDAIVDDRVAALISCLSQLQYRIAVRFGTRTETLLCQPADYVIEFPAEQRFSKLALVRAQIPRSPTTTKVTAP